MENHLPQRKNIRLKLYDYSLDGYYFITICVKNRLNLLGNVGVALLGDPNIVLSLEGLIVKKNIEICKLKLANVIIDEYIIMPNHIHMLIAIDKSRGAEDCAPYNSKNN